MRHSWGLICFLEFMDRVCKIVLPFQTFVFEESTEIGQHFETTSRSVCNEKEFIHNSTKQCVEHDQERLLQQAKLKAHFRRLMFVWFVGDVVFYKLYQKQKKLQKAQNTQFSNIEQLSVPLLFIYFTNNLDHEIEKALPCYVLLFWPVVCV